MNFTSGITPTTSRSVLWNSVIHLLWIILIHPRDLGRRVVRVTVFAHLFTFLEHDNLPWDQWEPPSCSPSLTIKTFSCFWTHCVHFNKRTGLLCTLHTQHGISASFPIREVITLTKYSPSVIFPLRCKIYDFKRDMVNHTQLCWSSGMILA